MKRQTLKRLAVKGTVAYVAVFSLVLMVAMPAMALIAARNSVDRRAIINGEVTYKDLAKNSVRTAKIAPKAVRYGKIASGAVRGNHIKDGHVKSADIGNGTIVNADISGGAGIADSKINYSTKTRYLSIPGISFRPQASADTFNSSHYDGYIYATGADSQVYFVAPVNLPDGAVVTRMQFNFIDNDNYTTPYTTVYLRRCNLTGVDQSMANVDSFASTPTPSYKTREDTSVSYGVIDNSKYRYYLSLMLNGIANTKLKAGGVIITYETTGP